MGQQAVGILYGCKSPELPNDDDGEAMCDLISRWEKFAKVPRDWSSKRLRIREENEGGKSLLGAWVAVGGSGEDNVPYFLEECMTVSAISDHFAAPIRQAAKLWKQFAAYIAKHEKGVKLSKPELWLTPCETA